MRSLQAAIRPQIVAPAVTQSPVLAKHFGAPPGHSFYDKFLASNRPKGGWAKVGYVQIIRYHIEVCNAVMQFAELERQESMAQRIIFYPKKWDQQRSTQKKPDPTLETSMRLLRSAASRYKVMLQAIDPAPGTGEGKDVSRRLVSQVLISTAVTPETLYPLTGLLSLTSFNRLIHLRPSGLIQDSDQLDLLFTLPMETPVLGISANHNGDSEASVVLIEPSNQAYQKITGQLLETGYQETEFLHGIPMMTDFAEDQVHLVVKTSALQLEKEPFDSAEFLKMTGYVHLTDPDLPGPEYNIPKDKVLSAQPSGAEPRKAWEKSYERFRQQRIDVCGLDLEPFESALA